MQKVRCRLFLLAFIAGSLAGCISIAEKTEVPDNTAPVVDATPERAASDIQKIADLERQIAREQRQCTAEKRRLEQALKESQKQNEDLQKKLDDLQKKLDALLAIDRDLRSRNRNR